MRPGFPGLCGTFASRAQLSVISFIPFYCLKYLIKSKDLTIKRLKLPMRGVIYFMCLAGVFHLLPTGGAQFPLTFHVYSFMLFIFTFRLETTVDTILHSTIGNTATGSHLKMLIKSYLGNSATCDRKGLCISTSAAYESSLLFSSGKASIKFSISYNST